MLLDDLLHGRQAQSGAEALGRKERLEDLGQDLFRNARPGIFDDELELPVFCLCADRDLTLALGTALRHRLRGVLDQVNDDATHPLRIEADLAARVELATKRDTVGQFLLVERVTEPLVGIDIAAGELLETREIEQIRDDAIAALNVAHDS